MDTALNPAEISKLKWRCRRGLLENDLFVERFFSTHEERLTPALVSGLTLLMDLADNDLLDLLLARKELDGELDRDDVRQVLALMRTPQR